MQQPTSVSVTHKGNALSSVEHFKVKDADELQDRQKLKQRKIKLCFIDKIVWTTISLQYQSIICPTK